MSQRAEKYARRMERRVDKLERAVGQITTEQVCQGIQISDLEDDLAVYRAAVAERDLKEARRKVREQRQHRRMEAQTRRESIRALVLPAALAALAALLLVLIGCWAEYTKEAERAKTASAVMAHGDPVVVFGLPEDADLQNEEALLAQGYFSLAVPMLFEYQDYMRTYCAEYGCPYPLAMAVAEIESRFDMDAVGETGEVGIMQLNPGADGAFHKELQDATGLDPTTPSGNIAGGCYLLGKYLNEYGDTEKALMAYNMGTAGARKAWAAGVTSTDYTAAILAAMENWECTVNAWNGQ